METTYFHTVKEGFSQWVDVLDFPLQLQQFTDFDFFYSTLIGDEEVAEAATQDQEVNYWRIQAEFVSQMAAAYTSRRNHFQEAFPKLIAEIRSNAFGLPVGEKRPRYQQALHELYTQMHQKVSECAVRWEDKTSPFGREHFQSTMRRTPVTSYSNKAFDALEKICMCIETTIHELTRWLGEFHRVIAEYFDKSPQKEIKSDTEYDSFEKLFPSCEILDTCVDALRRYRPENPVLGEGLTWKGGKKDKGLFVAWIERMESMKSPKITRLGNREHLVKLLNAYFINLNLGKDARVFSNIVTQKRKDDFIALLPD